MESSSMVAIDEMTFYRGNRAIFDGLTLQVPRGKITAVMGPSGAGKTTLLRLIGAQLYPQSGTITVDGENLLQMAKKDLYQARRKMGVLFQEGGLFTDLDVFENVAFPLEEHTRLPEDMIHDLVLMHLEAVGLRGAQHLRIHHLSGGMARRVALARAIILGPKLMMYDEPFTGQDPIGRGVLLRLIKELNGTLNLTSLIVSHDVQETTQIADHVIIIFDGTVLGEGSPEELMNNPSPQVQQFLRGLADGPVSFHYPAKPYKDDLL
ncbi:MAG: ABC transporter ATP-binding protein [Gammaproteobacteria bacterium RIFCSPHIGHO2_12_FULL_42_13]|nr:MAG: ABC transporter ATP-binding protein [Gammaproteobacteria bacterium RIFCSPHIGHO2_12_FULL_42_13]